MEVLFEGTRSMLVIAGACAAFVFLAMLIDLISGIRKSKQLGETCVSYTLSRSTRKFLIYEGSVIIATMVDVMIHYSHLFVLMKLYPIVGVPVITCLMSIFLCTIEFLSIRERAEDKVRRNMKRTLQVLVDMLGKENLSELLREKGMDTLHGHQTPPRNRNNSTHQQQ